MGLHGLLSVTIGVPNVTETAAYYTEFGLTPEDDNWFSTTDAGRQLHLVPAPVRCLRELRLDRLRRGPVLRAGRAVLLDRRAPGRRHNPTRGGSGDDCDG